MRFLIALPLLISCAYAQSLLIRGGTIYDGSGGKPYKADLRVVGEKIRQIGKLAPIKGEKVLIANGLVVAPGFIDAHSHADFGIPEHADAESQVRQGITTAVIGQDGIWQQPVKQELQRLMGFRPAINLAAFSGFGGIRGKVMGEDFKRVARADEIAAMAKLVEQDMKDGALGLSSGLEYDPGHYSATEELIALAKVVSGFGGIYISHVRDETNDQMESFRELISIGRGGSIPAQISHIKLAVASQWGKFQEIAGMLDSIGKEKLTADVYPYLYWQSTITVLTTSRNWDDPQVWEDALKDVGGPANVRLSKYSPDPKWVGKTLAELMASTGKTAPALIQEIISQTKDGKGEESIVCTAMREEDLQKFIAHPSIMFCSDGSIGGSHPRGAGSFPRIMGRYARDLKVIPLPEAIRKATSLPAWRFNLEGRGELIPGYKADIVVFDPKRINDRATPDNPTALSEGMVHVLVNGAVVLEGEKMTGERGGQPVLRGFTKW